VSALSEGTPLVDNEERRVQVRAGGRGSQVLVEVVRALDGAGVATAGLALRRPSLDDVFMSLTGHAAEEADGNGAGAASAKGRKGGSAKRAPQGGQ
jgi:ABC-2 type transport system ATP-binding protein